MFSRDAVRQVDAEAQATYAMPGLLLMENAARCLADAAIDLLGESGGERVLILAGPGNNGGDGFALARHLCNARCAVTIVRTHPRDSYRGDAATNLTIVEKMGLPIVEVDRTDVARSLRALPEADLLVDALLGTGLDRALESPILDVVHWINRERAAADERELRVVAVDIPTGLDCDTGAVHGAAVVADLTISFVGLKQGFFDLEAQKYIGEVYIGDIGVPAELVERLGVRIIVEDRHDYDGATEEEESEPDRPHDANDD